MFSVHQRSVQEFWSFIVKESVNVKFNCSVFVNLKNELGHEDDRPGRRWKLVNIYRNQEIVKKRVDQNHRVRETAISDRSIRWTAKEEPHLKPHTKSATAVYGGTIAQLSKR